MTHRLPSLLAELSALVTEMAVEPREDTDPLFRSVSPWELEDIIKSGRITGKGSAFSGDFKRTAGRVWFGPSVKDVAHHGTDWRRFLESTDEFRRAFALKEAIYAKMTEMQIPHNANPGARWNWPAWKLTFGEKLSALFGTYQGLVFKKLGALLKQFSDQQAKQPAGYVIEIGGVPGGTRYSGSDSRAGRRSGTTVSPDEVAMPATVKVDDVVRVYGLDTKGEVTQTWEKPSGGWALKMFATDDAGVAPDVQSELKAVDKMTQTYRTKFEAVEKAIERKSHLKEAAMPRQPVKSLLEALRAAVASDLAEGVPRTDIGDDLDYTGWQKSSAAFVTAVMSGGKRKAPKEAPGFVVVAFPFAELPNGDKTRLSKIASRGTLRKTVASEKEAWRLAKRLVADDEVEYLELLRPGNSTPERIFHIDDGWTKERR